MDFSTGKAEDGFGMPCRFHSNIGKIKKMKPRPRLLSVSALDLGVLTQGFSGLTGQILLVRELLVAFEGNELTLGWMIAQWLAGEAVGCLTAESRWARSRNPLLLFVATTASFCLLLPLTLFAARWIRLGAGTPLGETLSPAWILGSSFLLVAPLAFLHGALFPLACHLAQRRMSESSLTVGRVYVLETAGTLLGAILGIFFLVPHWNAFSIALGLAILNGLTCLGLAFAPHARENPRRILSPAFTLATLLTSAGMLMLFLRGDEFLHRDSLQKQWGNMRLVHAQPSRHAMVCVLENQGHYTFVANNQVVAMIPIPNRAETETLAHLPLLLHPSPRRLFVAGGGWGGLIHELLSHPSIEHVDCPELDSVLLKLLTAFPSPITTAEMTDPRVRVVLMDPRRFLRLAPEPYDVILIGFEDPTTLQLNRFFTYEFFSLVRRRLRPGGIVALRMRGGLSFLPDETKDLYHTLYHTLHAVFPHVRAFPGEGRTVLLAAEMPLPDLNTDQILSRAAERHLFEGTPAPWHLEQRLHPLWHEWFHQTIADRPSRINRDFHPIAVYHTMGRWLAIHAPSAAHLWRSLNLHVPGLRIFLWGGMAGIVALAFAARRRPSAPASNTTLRTIGTTGAAAMAMDLATLLAFQSTFGYIYGWMAGLLAAFMGGAASGAEWSRRHLPSPPNRITRLVVLDASVAGMVLAFPLFLHGLSLLAPNAETLASLSFLLLAFLAGAITGAQFSMAVAVWTSPPLPSHLPRSASLYAADLFGGWITAAAVPIFLFPLLGIEQTLLALGTLKVASFVQWNHNPIQGKNIDEYRNPRP